MLFFGCRRRADLVHSEVWGYWEIGSFSAKYSSLISFCLMLFPVFFVSKLPKSWFGLFLSYILYFHPPSSSSVSRAKATSPSCPPYLVKFPARRSTSPTALAMSLSRSMISCSTVTSTTAVLPDPCPRTFATLSSGLQRFIFSSFFSYRFDCLITIGNSQSHHIPFYTLWSSRSYCIGGNVDRDVAEKYFQLLEKQNRLVMEAW